MMTISGWDYYLSQEVEAYYGDGEAPCPQCGKGFMVRVKPHIWKCNLCHHKHDNREE